jgi:hypothetical protein
MITGREKSHITIDFWGREKKRREKKRKEKKEKMRRSHFKADIRGQPDTLFFIKEFVGFSP